MLSNAILGRSTFYILDLNGFWREFILQFI